MSDIKNTPSHNGYGPVEGCLIRVTNPSYAEYLNRGDYKVLAETWEAAAKDLAGQRDALAARCAELEAAVRWALGEGDSDFGEHRSTDSRGKVYPFWWRTELRARAFPPTPARKALDELHQMDQDAHTPRGNE